MLIISCQNNYLIETKWVIDFIFNDILEIPYVFSPKNSQDFTLSYFENSLTIASIFFKNKNNWLCPDSLPSGPLKKCDNLVKILDSKLIDNELPVIFGNSTFTIDRKGNGFLGLDIIGSIFFIMSRYEEVVISDRDQHDRFSSFTSFSYKENFLQRPIVDEYTEILFSSMTRIWSNLKRKVHKPQINVTCDVDLPYDDLIISKTKLAKRVCGDILKRKSFNLAYSTVVNSIAQRKGDWSKDPNNTFSWMMDACESQNRIASFFFISGGDTKYDSTYDLVDPFIQNLFQLIHKRDHCIGLHGSYLTYKNYLKISEEKKHLQKALLLAGVDHEITSNRQHYLRWDSKVTPYCLNKADIKYDSTGSFADYPGFRYGTSHEFFMWDWKSECPLKIKQVPLIVMEDSIFSKQYMDQSKTEKTLSLILTLKERALKFGGNFTLLWHNSNLFSEKDKEMFLEIIS